MKVFICKSLHFRFNGQTLNRKRRDSDSTTPDPAQFSDEPDPASIFLPVITTFIVVHAAIPGNGRHVFNGVLARLSVVVSGLFVHDEDV